MPLRFFTVPVAASDDAETELNAFLATHRVLTLDRRWVDLGASSFWAICVDYLPGRAGAGDKRDQRNRNRIDYKELLQPAEFAVFAKLRDLRKEIAQAEAVPVYTVFTNEQLAQIVQRRVKSKAELAKIEGVGEVRVEKYGDQLLQLLANLPEGSGATGEQAVREGG